jgi:hypothetical protein
MSKKTYRTTVTADSSRASETGPSETINAPYLHLCDEIGIEVDLTRRKRTPAEFIAGVAIVFLQGHLLGFKEDGFSVWEQRDQEGRQVRYPARKYRYTNDEGKVVEGTYVLFRTVTDGDFAPRKHLNELILEAVDAALARARQSNAAA